MNFQFFIARFGDAFPGEYMTWLAVHKKSAHEAKNPQNIYEELILPEKKMDL